MSPFLIGRNVCLVSGYVAMLVFLVDCRRMALGFAVFALLALLTGIAVSHFKK